MRRLRFLKYIDEFKAPVAINLTQVNQNPLLGTRYPTQLGSVAGGILSILLYFILIVYFISQLALMSNTNKDVYKSTELLNSFDTVEISMVEIQDYNFLPSVSVKRLHDDHQTIDIGSPLASDPEIIDADYNKLRSYVQAYLVMQVVTEGQTIFHHKELRNCKVADFQRNGIEIAEDRIDEMKARLCPALEEDISWFKLQNSYQNKADRISFSIELHKCDSAEASCQDQGNVTTLLNEVYFALHIVSEHSDHSTNSQSYVQAVHTSDDLHSEFQLGLDKFISNNNFVRPNSIFTKD